MSCELVVSRPGRPLELSEWRVFVEADESLRWRTAPSENVDPASGQNIVIAEPIWEAEWHFSGAYLPFLRYTDGVLRVRLAVPPADHFRDKVQQVAASLGGELREL
jgi:hypothetical protein